MGRKAGSLIRCTCVGCGTVELRHGCTSGYMCDTCASVHKNPYYRAHHAVALAVKHGTLKRPTEFPCTDCGKPATEYDHRDYSRPLDVQPVCHSCNGRRGPAGGRENAIAQPIPSH